MDLDVRITSPDEPVEGLEGFVRCLLPIRLEGEILLTFRTWMRASPTAGPGDVRSGRLANAIKPWGESILGAEVTVDGVDDGVPRVVDSPNETVKRMVTEVWRLEQEFYGWVVRPGTVLQVVCAFDDPVDVEWAIDIWRSIRYEGQPW